LNEKIAVLGAGSWGIASANLLATNKAQVTLWEFDPNELLLLEQRREHPQKLPGIKIDTSINLTGDIRIAVGDAEVVVIAVPTQRIAEVCRQLTQTQTRPNLVVNLSKGIEENTLRRVSQIIGEEWMGIDREAIVTLSGPSLAGEVARQLPTTVVIAGDDSKCRQAQMLFSNAAFRAYVSSDLTGVELGGSLKNVIAIAAGIARGLDFGDNTQGALITRGLVEISRLAVTMGARLETLGGLSGVGDLITTCISKNSRNQYVGFQIGRGHKLDEVLSGMVMVAEGVTTCRSARALAHKHAVEMPITEAVYSILFEGLSPRIAVNNLMTRPLKVETRQ